MTDRKKLIGLLTDSFDAQYNQRQLITPVHTADHLLANGVTFAKDTDVPSKWISVEDGLPETIPCGAGTSYSEAVNVLTSGRKVLTAIWNGTEFIADAEFWEAEGEKVTHWAPVPLPLPEPPKNNE